MIPRVGLKGGLGGGGASGGEQNAFFPRVKRNLCTSQRKEEKMYESSIA